MSRVSVRLIVSAIAVFLLVGLTASTASADTILTYTGLDFTNFNTPANTTNPYTTSDSVTGTIDLTTSLPLNLDINTQLCLTTDVGCIDAGGLGIVNSFSFTDGVDTVSNTTAGLTYFINFATNASGTITNVWDVEMSFGQNNIDIYNHSPFSDINVNNTNYGSSGDFADPFAASAFNTTPGTWSTSVPEPSSLALSVFGLGLFALFVRKRTAAAAGQSR